jgi:hypothetical protein
MSDIMNFPFSGLEDTPSVSVGEVANHPDKLTR